MQTRVYHLYPHRLLLSAVVHVVVYVVVLVRVVVYVAVHVAVKEGMETRILAI